MTKFVWMLMLVAEAVLAAPVNERAAVSPRQVAQPLPVPDSSELEKRLQALTWPQFRAVIQAIPQLKADVDAYGALGWQYVQARYQTYRWKKNIDKLHDDQKRELAQLIEQARMGKLPARPGGRKS